MRETQSSKECREAYENYRRRYVIQDVVPDAVWDFPIIRPEKPKHITRIQNFGKPKSERKFPYYSKAFINEMEELGRSSDKQDGEKFNTFVAEEWRRRYEGFFFFNGDILEYITGHHYCTLQYWKIQASKEIDGVYRKGRYQPDFRDAQRDVFYCMDNARRDNKCAGLAYISGRRSGKALCVETLIPTPDGLKKLKYINVGDVVYDKDGKECNVTFVTDIQHNKVVNRVWFDDETYLDADDDHQWSVTRKLDRKKWGAPQAPVVVLTTKEMKDEGLMACNERNFHIKVSGAVGFSEKELPIDPYLLGYWLGDGSTNANHIYSGDEDLGHVTNFIEELGLEYKVARDKTVNRVTIYGIQGHLNSLYLKGNKHIPDIYKYASINQREELVRGFMDSDGHISSHMCENTQKLTTLSEDFVFVLRSLGVKSIIKKKIAKCNDSISEVNRIHFNSYFNPFRLERKAALWEMPKSPRRYIKSVEKIDVIESKPVMCISVDSESRTYLAGKEFNVTHNTNSALAEGYWDTTENVEAIFAIQSKTLDDGRKQFKKVVDTWKFIPYWFKPEDTGDTTQSNKLYFGEKKQSGKDIKERAYREVLNSIIYPENSKEAALDGEYVSYYFGDELGKSQKGLDIYERWNITRECLFDGNRIVGFAMNVSTVEDMDKYGSESFKLLWDKSDAKKRLPNGLTETYLYQLFLPAYYGYVGEDNNNVSFVDEWGYSNVDAAKRYHKKQYEARSGNSLLSYQRKYPLSIQDCWVTTDGKNNFSTSRLIEQKIWNDDTSYQDVVHGNFMWKNGIKWGEVDFYPCPVHEARWQVAWMPNESDRNRFETYLGGQKKPTRSFCVTGIDPFSHGKVVDEKQGSNGAAVTILKSYPGSTIKEGVVCLYNHRQPDANLQVEDYIMQAIFYSSPVLAESNVSVVVNGFQDKGFYGFLEYNPLETDLRKRGRGLKGFATTSAENVENLISMSASYILDNVGRQENGTYGFVPFNDLIQQWLDFTPDKRTPFDLVIAAGLAIILLRAKRQRTENNIPKESFFPKISKEGYAKLSSMVRRKDPIDDFN